MGLGLVGTWHLTAALCSFYFHPVVALCTPQGSPFLELPGIGGQLCILTADLAVSSCFELLRVK